MSGSDENGSPGASNKAEDPPVSEHLNIKVTDNNNEVFFKIKRTTQLKKLMDAFCERQGKTPQSVRFLFDGSRVNPTDSPDTVSLLCSHRFLTGVPYLRLSCFATQGSTTSLYLYIRLRPSKLRIANPESL